jgi:hypothetical protein
MTRYLNHVVEGDSAVLHELPGPQHGMSVARTGSPPWMRLSGSEASLYRNAINAGKLGYISLTVGQMSPIPYTIVMTRKNGKGQFEQFS